MKLSSRGFLLMLLSIAAFNIHAINYKVKGVVADSIGEPESFATVRVFLMPDTVKPAKAGVADESGAFSIDLPSQGNYKVNIFAFGKSPENRVVSLSPSQPEADLGKIILSTTSSTLEELVVTAQKPLVVKEIDRVGYDVQADPDSKASQLDEILKRVPLVSVESDGTIKVKGSTNFKIYKNGRPNNSFSNNAKDIFKSIPASMIKKIEVITDPGSREDAEGTSAILNIVTMENTVIKGVMGNVGLNYRSPGLPNPNIWLSSQIDKVSFSFYGGGNISNKKSTKSRHESLMHYDDSGNEQKSETESSSKGAFGYFGTDVSYELDSLNLFTAELGGYIYDIRPNSFGRTVMTDSSGKELYSYSSHSTSSPNRYFDVNGGFNYQRSTHRKGETIILSYLVSSTNQRQHSRTDYDDQKNMPVPYTGMENDFNLNFIEHTGQIDWTRPINDMNKFDVGSKYINRRNHSLNDINYFDDRKEHSDFSHITQVLAFYFDYRLKYKNFGARAGVRYEYSRLSAKYKDGSNDPFHSNLSDWVPNAAISYNINDANSIKVSYSSRINRPGISQLNPAVVETPSSISSGNPDLGSSRHQSFSLNYGFISRKVSIDFDASYSFSNNAVISVQDLIDGDIIRSSYANAGHNKSFFASLWAQFTLTPKTSLMTSIYASWTKNENRSLGISQQGWSGHLFAVLRQRLPWDLQVSVNVNGYRPGPSLYSKNTTSLADNINYGISINKSLLKEKRLNVRVGIDNPFRKSPILSKSEPINSGYSGYSHNWRYNSSNTVSVGVSYRFGSLNVQVKKTAKSISNDDLEGRKNE